MSKIFDIYDFQESKKEKLDVIFCGFPCQSFSSAGNKKGFEDETRGTLIFKMIEIVKKTKPKIVLLENVKHLVNHNNKKTFNTIIEKFKKLNYITTKKPLILNPFKDFNMHQNRERVFIPLVSSEIERKLKFLEEDITVLKSDYNFVFSKDENPNKKLYVKKSDELLKALTAWKEFVEHFKKLNKKIPVIWLDEMCRKNYVSNSNCQNKDWYKNYIKAMKNFYKENKNYIDKWIKKFKPFEWKLRRNRKLEWQAGNTNFDEAYLQPRQSGLRFRKNLCFPTLVATVQVPLLKDEKGWRLLSTKEVSRLQSFPENHQICENDFQAYKQYGNSINVKVAEWVIDAYLKKYLEVL